MLTLRARLIIVASLILTSPIAAFAGNPDKSETLWDWIVRMMAWAAGSWHLY